MKKMIFKPLEYLGIVWNEQNRNGKIKNTKKWVDIYIPLFLSLVFSLIMITLSYFHNYNLFFKSESFNLISSFLQTLPGFYIAALAAIVSFNNDLLDLIDPNDSPLDTRGRNMTFRRFLSNTFAYLSWLSIFLILYCFVLKYIFENGDYDLKSSTFSIIYSLLVISFSFLFSQLITISAMSLSYLGDRIHRP